MNSNNIDTSNSKPLNKTKKRKFFISALIAGLVIFAVISVAVFNNPHIIANAKAGFKKTLTASKPFQSDFFDTDDLSYNDEDGAQSMSDLQSTIGIKQNIRYRTTPGIDANLQSLDVYYPKVENEKTTNHPIMIMVHGGGWRQGDKTNKTVVYPKAKFFVEQNYIFVSINYRLAPDAQFPDYPSDVAAAISWVYDNAESLNGDKDNLYLMGHSAGAHLAALVSIDNQYLNEAGKDNSIIKGTILLDGAGYNIPYVMKNSKGDGRKLYLQAFTSDPEVWKEASPTLKITANQDYPPVLAFHIENRKLSQYVATELVDTLGQYGCTAKVVEAKNRDHESLNAKFGEPDDVVSKQTMEFIEFISQQSENTCK